LHNDRGGYGCGVEHTGRAEHRANGGRGAWGPSGGGAGAIGGAVRGSGRGSGERVAGRGRAVLGNGGRGGRGRLRRGAATVWVRREPGDGSLRERDLADDGGDDPDSPRGLPLSVVRRPGDPARRPVGVAGGSDQPAAPGPFEPLLCGRALRRGVHPLGGGEWRAGERQAGPARERRVGRPFGSAASDGALGGDGARGRARRGAGVRGDRRGVLLHDPAR
jgi:hypothetical protein